MEQIEKGVENLKIENYAEKIKELKGLPNLPKEFITLKEIDSNDNTTNAVNAPYIDPQGSYTLTKPFTAQIVSGDT